MHTKGAVLGYANIMQYHAVLLVKQVKVHTSQGGSYEAPWSTLDGMLVHIKTS